jgi:hypothetical protein
MLAICSNQNHFSINLGELIVDGRAMGVGMSDTQCRVDHSFCNRVIVARKGSIFLLVVETF